MFHRLFDIARSHKRTTIEEIDPTYTKGFEYYQLRQGPVLSTRIPVEGIELQPFEYHTRSLPVFNEQGRAGPPPMRGVERIIREYHPSWLYILDVYCRPTANDVDAIFEDFNRVQLDMPDIPTERIDTLMPLLRHFLGIQPYDILHWCDTRFAKWTLSTRTDYYHLHNRQRTAEAAEEGTDTGHLPGSTGPTKKSWFVNTHLKHDRTVCHNIKMYGLPFVPTGDEEKDIDLLMHFFRKRPTEMLVRSHISNLYKELKVRPVYNVDFFFLRLECMVAYPLMCQARRKECCIMYGLETIRGGMCEIERLSNAFDSFISADWHRFDHDASWKAKRTFFTHYLPSLILCDSGYAESEQYHNGHFQQYNTDDYRRKARQQAEALFALNINPGYTIEELEELIFANKTQNILDFLQLWFEEMIYVLPDGYAYKRLHSGVPSGQLLTQWIDSYINLLVVLDAMLEFGFTSDEIRTFLFLIMGDDNVVFSQGMGDRFEAFFYYLPEFAKKNHNMHISVDKSLFTRVRSKIEILSYRNNFGQPSRDIEKLVAQLAYPERHVTDAIMVFRAIGMTYAGCGQFPEFHTLCRRVFMYYHSKTGYMPLNELAKLITGQDIVLDEITDADELLKMRALPGMFKMFDKVDLAINFTHFPTLDEVRRRVNHHHGYFTEEPAWDYSYFINPPDPKREGMFTLADLHAKYGDRFRIKLTT